MALFNLGTSAPQHMEQAIFDEAVFRLYCLRHQYEDFQSFWHAKAMGPNGEEVRLVDGLLAQASKYPKDDSLRAQLSQACLEIEKYWYKKFGASPESITIFKSIHSQAEGVLSAPG
jgi:hypothetical protein